MGSTWVLSAPDGPHVGPMNLAIWVYIPLTYWSLEDVAMIWKMKYPIACYKFMSTSCEMFQVNVTPLMILNIGSGNGLVPAGIKLLPEPMLIQIYGGIWRHQVTMNWVGSKQCFSRRSLLCFKFSVCIILYPISWYVCFFDIAVVLAHTVVIQKAFINCTELNVAPIVSLFMST